MVDIDPAELEKPTVRPDLPICADAGYFLRGLTVQVGLLDIAPWREYCRKMRAKYPPLREFSINPADKVHPYLFMEKLSQILPPESRVVASNGTACVAFFRHLKARRGNGFY